MNIKNKTKLIIIGGFLGAGKTTLLNVTSQILKQEGKSVGLITNDQAKGLVDTKVLSGNGHVQEIAGSCFCCDFDGLMEAALYLRDTAKCNIILAEPVGSCTDLSATLLQPIKYYYQQYFELLPLTVLVDPLRLKETFASEANPAEGSGYIYLKQLEEADYLVINKKDLLSAAEQDELKSFIKQKFPDYPLRFVSALKEDGINNWLQTLYSDASVGTRIAKIDYDIYAEGEALMGWYNAEFNVANAGHNLIPWREFNFRFLKMLRNVFQYEGIDIGHMKTFLKSGPSTINANLTGANREIFVSGTPYSSTSSILTVNIRAEASPERLNSIMDDVIRVILEEGIIFQRKTLNFLSPGRPDPTHRYSKVYQ